MSPGVEVVGCEELEHEEEQVDSQTDEHCLVLEVFFIVQSGLRPPPPDVTSHRGPGYCDTFPHPEGEEHRPPGPGYDPVQLECVQN